MLAFLFGTPWRAPTTYLWQPNRTVWPGSKSSLALKSPSIPMWHRRWVESQEACLGQPHTLSGSRWPYSWSRGWNTQPGWPHGGCTRVLRCIVIRMSYSHWKPRGKKLSILKCSILIEHLRYSEINWSGENSHWKDSSLLPVPMRRLLAMPLGTIQKATRVVSKKRGRRLWTRTFVVVSVGGNRIC